MERLSASLTGLIGLSTAAYLFYQNNAVKTTTYEAVSRQYDGLDGLKIIQLADLFYPQNKTTLLRILKKVQNEQPDLIVLTGGMIDRRFDLVQSEKYRLFLEGLRQIAPVYASFGESEAQFPDQTNYRHLLEKEDIHLLLNEAITLHYQDASYVLMGLREQLNGQFLKKNALETIKLQEEQKGLPKILMAYHPEAFLHYHQNQETSPDFVFAASALGGGIRDFYGNSLWAPYQGFFPKYTKGLFHLPENKEKEMLISRGLGRPMTGLRWHNQPEIVSVVFRKEA